MHGSAAAGKVNHSSDAPRGLVGELKPFAAAVDPPANDDWANAEVLSPVGGGVLTGDDTAATVENLEPNTDTPNFFGNTVWYRYDAATAGRVWFNLQPQYSRGSLVVYTGDAIGTLEAATEVAAGPSPQTVGLDAVAGTTYWIQIGTSDSTAGPFILSWTANDDFANAVTLTPPEGGAVSGDNAPATVQTNPDEPGGFSHTVWYRYQPTADTRTSFTLETEYARGSLAIYTGDALDTLEPAGEPVSGASTLNLALDVTANTTYWIQVGAAEDTGGLFALGWFPAPPNDAFAGALPLSPPSGGAIGGDNSTATSEAGEPGNFGNTLWYSYTSDTSGLVSFHLDTRYTRASLGVYTGTALGNLVAAAPTASGDSSEAVNLNAQAGTTYWVQVGAVDDTGGPFTLSWTGTPANDAMVNASAFPALNGEVQGDNAGATVEEGEDNSFGHTVWYSVTPQQAGTLALSLQTSDWAGAMTVYTGTAFPLVNAGGPVHGTASLQFNVHLDANVRYLIQVGADDSSGGPFTLSWTFQPDNRPVNDDFADAIGLQGDSGSATGTTVGATVEDGEPTSLIEADEPTGFTIWWNWTAPATGDYTFDTFGSTLPSGAPDLDTTLAVFTGPGVSELTEVTSNDDAGSTQDTELNSQVTFTAQQGTTYRIQVGAFDAED